MPDFVNQILPGLRQHRLDGLDLGTEFVYPNYEGRSILNIPSSICQFFGSPTLGARPLVPEITQVVGDHIQRVVLVLMDAMALHRFLRWMDDGSAPVWRALLQDGLLAPLTSITPSTTSSALTTLWTGRSPAEHGIMGYEMWLKEYGVVANMILHAPITFKNATGSLNKAGFNPEKFLGLRMLGTHLLENGVKSYALQHYTIVKSGLSQMLFKDVNVHTFGTAADMWINLRQLLESRPRERFYTWVYWSEVDHLSHFHGPDDERPQAEFATFSMAMERFFLKRLSPELKRGTLLILTADHGQIGTRKDPHFELRHHPNLVRRLHILPSGENRLAYFFVRPGQTGAVREYLERAWPNQFALLGPAHAVAQGLFGPGRQHPRLLDRLGEYIIVGRGAAYLWWADKDNHLLGRHGGLHPEEMFVPFLAARLG